MTLSDIERQTNQLTDENLSLALHTLKEQGFVILEAALPQSCVTKMRNLFDEESKRQFGDMGGEGELEIVDVEAARIIKGFSKEHDKLKAVSVSIGGELFGAEDLDRLASLPSLDEARSQLLSVFKAPLSQLLRTLDEPPAMLARLLQGRGDQ